MASLANGSDDCERGIGSDRSNLGKSDEGETPRASVGQILELLISEGHDESRVLHYSPDKIRLYYECARKRRGKESAALQLATLHAVHAAIFGTKSSEGFDLFKKHESILRDAISGEVGKIKEQDQSEGLKRLGKALAARGVRIAHSPLQK